MTAPTVAPPVVPARYPTEYVNRALLLDGSVISIRPIRPEDVGALDAFHEGLSPETVHRRYFYAHPHLKARELERLTRVDHRDRFALLALEGEAIVAVARYERVGDTDLAEVAFVVDDRRQGRGVGTLLLEHLAHAARRQGIRRFAAVTQPDNAAMQEVLRRVGVEVASRCLPGEVDVSFDIEPTQAYLDAITARSVTAMAAAAGPCLPGAAGTGPKVGLAFQDPETEAELVTRLVRLGLTPVCPRPPDGSTLELAELISASHTDPEVQVTVVQAHHLLRPRTVMAVTRQLVTTKPIVALVSWPGIQPWNQAGATTVRGVELAAHWVADLATGQQYWHRPERGSIDLASGEHRMHLPRPLDGLDGDAHATMALDSGWTRGILETYRLPVTGLPWAGAAHDATLVIGDEGGAHLTARMIGPSGATIVRFLPLTNIDARDMTRLLRVPELDEEVVGAIHRSAQLVEDEPAIRRLQLPLGEHQERGPGRALILVGARRGTEDDPLLRRTERQP